MRKLKMEIVVIDLPQRIGHLAAEPDWYLKRNRLDNRRVKPVMPVDPENVVNPFLLECWANYFYIVKSKRLYNYFRRKPPVKNFPRQLVRLKPDDYSYTMSNYNGHPLLSLDETQKEKGRKIAQEMGIPRDAWFVCFHNREPGYLPNLKYHGYRDCKIENFIPAMEYIVSLGGWAVRMGDPSMEKLPAKKNVVDYAHHEKRSGFMDVFFSSQCMFFVGNTSGPFIVAEIFGVPSALTNFIPLEDKPFLPESRYIPKLLFSKMKKRHLTFGEILHSEICKYYYSEDYEKAELDVQESCTRDIVQLVEEMVNAFKRKDGRKKTEIPMEELQQRFYDLYTGEHLGYHSKARIGGTFIKKYAHLLEV
ncbi:MAG: TIGR04372 family glycosyltransferase [bacterium]|nr:TIGR04372 family glycosyltransferase [bacterium]